MKVAILGCGGIAHAMGRTLRGIVDKGIPDIIPYAAASRSLAKAEQFAAEFGIEKAYGSYEEMQWEPGSKPAWISSAWSR